MYPSEIAVKIPGLSVADILVEDERLILREHADRVDPRVDAVGQREVDDPILRTERNRRLCDIIGESIEPAALPSGQ